MNQETSSFVAFLPLITLTIFLIKGWLFARIAKNMGKSFGLYFVLGIFPISDFIALILLGNQDTIRCPQCAERIRKEANKCWHCGHEINI